MLLTLVALAWMELGRLGRRVSTLEQTSQTLEKDVQRAQGFIEKAEDLQTWSNAHPNWLNELESLSTAERFPPAEDARITSLKTSPRPAGGGLMSLAGFARDSDVILELENLVRDERHTVVAGPSRESDKDPRYPRYFQESVKIDSVVDDDGHPPANDGGSR